MPKAKKKSSRRTTVGRRTVQRSISLSPAQWKRLDALGDITQWGRSGVTAQALDLLVDVSVPVAQRFAALKRTSVGPSLRERVRAAITAAVAEVEAANPSDPWAEFDAALELAAPDLERTGLADQSDEVLRSMAERATRKLRKGRVSVPSRA